MKLNNLILNEIKYRFNDIICSTAYRRKMIHRDQALEMAKDLIKNDFSLKKTIECFFDSVAFDGTIIIFTTPPMTHEAMASYRVASFLGDKGEFYMGKCKISVDSLDPQLEWENKNFHHGHLSYGNPIRIGKNCLGEYSHPEDTALRAGPSAFLISVISFLKYSRYGTICSDKKGAI